MSETAENRARRRGISWGVAVYLLLACAVCVTGYRHPTFSADQVPFAATVLNLDSTDIKAIHKKVYGDLVAEIGPQRDKEYLGDSEWWPSMRYEPRYLMEEIPFYANRPLYIMLAHALVKNGMDVFPALHLISTVSLFAIALVLLAWVRNPFYAALLLLSGSLLVVGKTAAADALSTAFLLSGFYALFRNRLSLGFLLLLLSVWVRTDNAIVVIVTALAFWMRIEAPRLRWFKAGVICVLAAGSELLINRLSGWYGWKAILINTHGAVIAPGEHVFSLSFGGYLNLLYLGLRSLFSESEMAIWLLVAMLGWRLLAPGSRMREFLAIAAIAFVLRYPIFPFPEDRYFMWAYLMAGIALVSAFLARDEDQRHPRAAAAQA